MQRIDPISLADASPKAAELLATVKRQVGGVPNILATMAQSPAALGGYLGFAGALSGGRIDAKLREQISLAVAGANACDYCASAHSALGAKQGVPREEIARNLRGDSAEPRTHAALTFVNELVATRGKVSDASLDVVRSAGFSDEEIVEIVANTAMNIFTNYFNHVAGTEIDFPRVSAAALHAA